MRTSIPVMPTLMTAASLVTGATSFAWTGGQGAGEAQDPRRIELVDCPHAGQDAKLKCGTLHVYEDRASGTGRKIPLEIAVLPATGDDPRPDPIFVMAGGPGQAATSLVRQYVNSWMRRGRDIVFVDQRGTGKSNALGCSLVGSDDDLQSYFEPLFRPEVFQACLEELEAVADLRFYTTPIAMDDLNEVRAALGYDEINLVGGSYGTRASLVYMRRHPETTRSAILTGVAPIGFTNPLFHAREAQWAIDAIFAECAATPECRAAFPDLDVEFQTVLERLEQEPAEVVVPHPVTGKDVAVKLSRGAFAEAVRVMMYSLRTSRSVPLLVHRAFEGDYAPFASAGLRTNRALRRILSVGMLLCVTCNEDVARIDPETIESITGDTFLGDGRVRQQMAVCELWPVAELPADYGEPVRAQTPVLLLSGTIDPVTSPFWGEEAASHLPNGLHVVVPGAHGLSGSCVDQLKRDFLAAASVEGLDTSCVEGVRLPPLRLKE